jgi:hypothetical protein
LRGEPNQRFTAVASWHMPFTIRLHCRKMKKFRSVENLPAERPRTNPQVRANAPLRSQIRRASEAVACETQKRTTPKGDEKRNDLSQQLLGLETHWIPEIRRVDNEILHRSCLRPARANARPGMTDHSPLQSRFYPESTRKTRTRMAAGRTRAKTTLATPKPHLNRLSYDVESDNTHQQFSLIIQSKSKSKPESKPSSRTSRRRRRSR